jgi:hypothetical protein
MGEVEREASAWRARSTPDCDSILGLWRGGGRWWAVAPAQPLRAPRRRHPPRGAVDRRPATSFNPSANEASANEASANEASANEASANEASANEASANEASANEAGGQR